MLQNYRFSGTFKTVTLTTVILNLYTTYKHIIHNLSTSYPQAKNTYKINNKQYIQ